MFPVVEVRQLAEIERLDSDEALDFLDQVEGDLVGARVDVRGSTGRPRRVIVRASIVRNTMVSTNSPIRMTAISPANTRSA